MEKINKFQPEQMNNFNKRPFMLPKICRDTHKIKEIVQCFLMTKDFKDTTRDILYVIILYTLFILYVLYLLLYVLYDRWKGEFQLKSYF